jgi:hypothetical protein
MVAVFSQTRPWAPALVRQAQQSNDVQWLERLCTDLPFAEAEYAERGQNTGGVKGSRSAAYVRLGAIGSPASLAALARVEKVSYQRSVLPRPATPALPAYHPAPHMSDPVWRPVAQLRLQDGRSVGAYILSDYGPPTLFIALQRGQTWSPPLMIPMPMPYFDTPAIVLNEAAQGRIRFGFTPPDRGVRGTPIYPTPDAIEVLLREVERDSDADGWTDIAERHLQMNWLSKDSDGDGIPDDRDAAPTYREPGALDDDDARILRRAIFSMFGLTESPGALFVADNSRRLQPAGLPGPLFYREGNGGVRLTWKILRKTENAATVELTDLEGALAASGNEVSLRKIDGNWYVVAIRGVWIS